MQARNTSMVGCRPHRQANRAGPIVDTRQRERQMRRLELPRQAQRLFPAHGPITCLVSYVGGIEEKLYVITCFEPEPARNGNG